MTTTPTGAPAWTLTANHEVYGGHTEKQNYQSEGAINPKTDVSVEQFCRMVADLAAVVRTAPFAAMSFTCDDTTPGVPTVNSYNSMAGLEPTGARNGDGDVTFRWLADYSDPYSVSGDLNIEHAIATVHEGVAGPYTASVELLDPDGNSKNESVRVRVLDAAGAAVAGAKCTLLVWCGV